MIKEFLPYYKLSKTVKDKEFFFSHDGYFNFWNEYLLLRIREHNDNGIGAVVLVNRPGFIFTKTNFQIEEHKDNYCAEIKKSMLAGIPEEMFIDFPELNRDIVIAHISL